MSAYMRRTYGFLLLWIVAPLIGVPLLAYYLAPLVAAVFASGCCVLAAVCSAIYIEAGNWSVRGERDRARSLAAALEAEAARVQTLCDKAERAYWQRPSGAALVSLADLDKVTGRVSVRANPGAGVLP